MRMTRLGLVGAIASGVLLVTLSGCGGTATPQGSVAAAPPSQPAPSVAPPSAAASVAAPSEGAPSFAIPSFVLPSEAKDLEALLPNTLCGATATKASMTGASFAQSGQSEFLDALKAVGKTAADVAFAIAVAPGNGCTAGIFRVAGADPNLLKSAMLASQSQSGQAATQSTVGGKDVYVTAGASATTYVYFHGDAVIFAGAKTETDAAGILQALP
jgi:hypothetical protein